MQQRFREELPECLVHPLTAGATFLDTVDAEGVILGAEETTDKRCEVRMLVLNKKLRILDIK